MWPGIIAAFVDTFAWLVNRLVVTTGLPAGRGAVWRCTSIAGPITRSVDGSARSIKVFSVITVFSALSPC
jgi:hypothetical protein